MHPRTITTLERLKDSPWFSRVGVKDTEAAIVLSSWKEAIECCSAAEWEDLCLEAINCYRERLVERSPNILNGWNQKVDELKVVTVPFVRDCIGRVMDKNSFPKIFEDTVHWDILHLCLESEYADIFKPGFYASQAYGYTKGHFPCGWNGNFPNGKLIIY